MTNRPPEREQAARGVRALIAGAFAGAQAADPSVPSAARKKPSALPPPALDKARKRGILLSDLRIIPNF